MTHSKLVCFVPLSMCRYFQFILTIVGNNGVAKYTMNCKIPTAAEMNGILNTSIASFFGLLGIETQHESSMDGMISCCLSVCYISGFFLILRPLESLNESY